MARRFELPAVSRRQISLVLAILVLAAAAAYLLQYRGPHSPIAAEAVRKFRAVCVREARHANGGGDLVMDDETETRIGAYCGCIVDGIEAKIPPLEVAKIADGSMSDDTTRKLSVIISDCQVKLQQP